MVIKYYGNVDANGKNLIFPLYFADPYKHVTSAPSYCVWIVPGTIDANGNPID